MHQIRFPLELRTPAVGAGSAPPDSLVVFKGPTSKKERWKRRLGRKGRRKGKSEGKGEQVDGGIWPTQKFRRGASYAGSDGLRMSRKICQQGSRMCEATKETARQTDVDRGDYSSSSVVGSAGANYGRE